MKPYPNKIYNTTEDHTITLDAISRARLEDISEFNNLPNVFMRGRKVGKIPTSSTDISPTDKDGDFNYDETYVYLCVPSGSTVVWKTITYSNFSQNYYGSMGADDITQVVTVSSAGVYYDVTGGLTSGLVNGFTFQNSKELKCLNAGVYLIDWSMSLKVGTANQVLAGAITINSNVVDISENMNESTSANKNYSVSGTCIVNLAVNDLIRLCVENETAANDITVTHASLSITKA